MRNADRSRRRRSPQTGSRRSGAGRAGSEAASRTARARSSLSGVGHPVDAVLALQASAGNGAVARLLQVGRTDRWVQRIGRGAARANLRSADRGVLADFSARFVGRHIGLNPPNTNKSAAEVHAGRANPPLVNTVVMTNPRTVKTELADGNWVSSGNHWVVTAANAVDQQDTRRRNDAFVAVPKRIPLPGGFNLNEEPAQAGAPGPGDFTRNGADRGVANTALGAAPRDWRDVTPAEFDAATQTMGAWPVGNSMRRRRQKNAWRRELITKVNLARKDDWIRENFDRIGAQDLDAANAPADVNQIPRRAEQITVWVRKSNGEIYHFVGYQ